MAPRRSTLRLLPETLKQIGPSLVAVLGLIAAAAVCVGFKVVAYCVAGADLGVLLLLAGAAVLMQRRRPRGRMR